MPGKIRSVAALFSFFILLYADFAVYAAQVPKSEKEIPIISGAIRDTKEEASIKEMEGDTPGSARNLSIKVYKTKNSPEEVFNFYLQAIGGKQDAFYDPMMIKPGATGQVSYEMDYYSDEDFEDYFIENDVKHEGKLVQQNLIKNRKPVKPGKWIKGGYFVWNKKEANNDLTEFYIIIHDNSLESGPKNYRTETQIQVKVTSMKSEQAMREEEDEEMDMEVQALAKTLKNKPPTEKDLGVPMYPGAKFNPDASAGMTAGNDFAIYIYLSSDPPSKVAAFYEQKMKRKPVSTEKDSYMLPLKGKMPMPDEAITIEPNTMFGGSAKTVISIQKMIAEK